MGRRALPRPLGQGEAAPAAAAPTDRPRRPASRRPRFCCACGREGDFPSNLCPACSGAAAAPAPAPVRPAPPAKLEAARCPGCGRVRREAGGPWEEGGLEGPAKSRFCDDCARMRSNRIVAIVQVRCPRPLDERQLEAVRRCLGPVPPTKYRAEDAPNGLDLLFIEQNVALDAARCMADRLCGQVTSTRTLVTQDHATGKEVFRRTHLVRLPSLAPGSLVAAEGGPARVVSLGPRGAALRSLATGDARLLPRRQAAHLAELPEELVHEGVVSALSPTEVFVTLLDSYETLSIPRPTGRAPGEGERVRVVLDGGRPLIDF